MFWRFNNGAFIADLKGTQTLRLVDITVLFLFNIWDTGKSSCNAVSWPLIPHQEGEKYSGWNFTSNDRNETPSNQSPSLSRI